MCFYPRHTRGWRRTKMISRSRNAQVSIHATLAGGDDAAATEKSAKCKFLSTPPSRVATASQTVSLWHRPVSIHATLAGGDGAQGHAENEQVRFLSTPPSRVATALPRGISCRETSFYPRHPRGGRRPKVPSGWRTIFVSIHATLAGGDRSTTDCGVAKKRFYPRHPRGWRRQKCTKMYSVFCAKGKNYL